MTSAAAKIAIEFEGLRLAPYLCPAGVWTIGYGATYALDGNRVTASTLPLSESEADQLLERDLMLAGRAVDRLITVPLDPEEKAALTDFVFNLGSGSLKASTLRRWLNDGEYHEVPDQLMRWVFAGGRKLAGLVRRRNVEAVLWSTP